MTTGTVFDKHKLPLAKLVRAMMFYEQTGGKGKTADLASLLFVTWKTAYVLKMKLFEAYAAPRRAAIGKSRYRPRVLARL